MAFFNKEIFAKIHIIKKNNIIKQKKEERGVTYGKEKKEAKEIVDVLKMFINDCETEKKETEEIANVLKIFINDLDVDLVLYGEDDDIKRIRNYLSIQSKNNDNKIDIIRLVERICKW